MSLLPLEQEIEYPTSDGQPMAETPQHMQVMVDVIFGLKRRYRQVSDVWVGGNLFFFYERGNPKAKVAPDVLLAKGVRQWNRPNYKVWEDGPPVLVVEVTSKKTRHKDQEVKKPLYQNLGVKEFVLFDPFGEYLRPPLQGFRLLRGRYQPIPLEADGSLRSRTTGLWLKREGQRLRLVDVKTGEPILWQEELEAAHAREAAARQAEAVARQAAEARAAEETAARQAAEARATEEAAARQAVEERVRALEAELNRLRKG
ncbi:MAG TPA: Uma2 family endonuclease [Thermoanaerobaculia bacterium]|nr:Uma2 family endonuclease [Thermoanaerobaculia bacterium]